MQYKKNIIRLFGLLFIGFLSLSCRHEKSTEINVVKLPNPTPTNSAQPNLSTGDSGAIVLSWLRQQDEQTSLSYAVFQDSAWGSPNEVAYGTNWLANWADFPSVVQIHQNLWAAHWLVLSSIEQFTYDLMVSTSTDGGKNWKPAIRPHQDGTLTEHGFASLFASAEDRSESVEVAWLDGRNMAKGNLEHSGMTLRSARLTSQRSEPQRIESTAEIDDLVCDCCQTAAAQTSKGAILAYRNRDANEIRDIYVSRQVDDKWQSPTLVSADNWHITGCPVNGPAIIADESHVAVAWYTAAQQKNRIQVAWSNDAGASFQPATVIDVGAVIGRVGLTQLTSSKAVVSWLPRGADGQGEICIRSVSTSGELGKIHVVTNTDIARQSGFPQIANADGRIIIAHTEYTSDKPQITTYMIDSAQL